MNATFRTRVTAAVVTTLGGAALAVGAVFASAPASAATMAEVCVQHPERYASGAVLGEYSVHKSGWDRLRVCKVYDSAHKLLGTTTETDYGFFRAPVLPSPPSSKSSVA